MLEETSDPRRPQRLGGAVPAIGAASGFSCAHATNKFLILGTRHGTLHVLDHWGNEAKSLSAHNEVVLQVSIDERGEFAASCAGDNSVALVDLYEGQVVQKCSLQQPVEAIALDPRYSQTGNFVTGGLDGQVTLKFARRKAGNPSWPWSRPGDKLLPSGNGSILDIKWRGEHIAWVCYDGSISILNCVTWELLPVIGAAKEQQRLPRGCKAHLVWQSNSVLLCGWGHQVRVLVVREISSDEASCNLDFCREELQEFQLGDKLIQGMRYVEAVTVINTSQQQICGLAPCGMQQVAVLVLGRSCTQRYEDLKVEVLDWKGVVVETETLLELGKSEKLKACDYILAFSPDDDLYYIVTPKEVVTIEGRYWDKGEEVLPAGNIFEVMLCALATSDDPKQRRKLPEYLKIWPSSCFSELALSSFLDSQLRNRRCPHLQEALKQLYLAQRRFEDALVVYLEQQDCCVFHFIQQWKLQAALTGKILPLVSISPREAVELLVQARDVLPASQVASELRDTNRRALEEYLWRLFQQDTEYCPHLHSLQLHLLAEFRLGSLIDFLKSSRYYDAQKAYEECSNRKYVPGMVFLLARQGKNKEAVKLMTDNFGRIRELMDAVAGFPGVWELLVAKAKQERKLMDAILQHPAGKNHLLNPVSFRNSLVKKIALLRNDGFESSSTEMCKQQQQQQHQAQHLNQLQLPHRQQDMESLMDDIWFFDSVLKYPVVAR